MIDGIITLATISGAVSVSGIIAVAAQLPVVGPYLQYGALGLCAMTLVGIYKIYLRFELERKRLVDVIEKKDDQLLGVMKENNKALAEIAAGLKARPCLKD